MESPFEITIYNKDFEFEGSIVDVGFAYFVPAWRSLGYGNFMIDANNPHTEAIQAPGARVVVKYRGVHLLSGPVRSRRGDLLPNGTVTYQVSDDRRLNRNTLAWVKPTAPLEASSLADLGQTWRPQGGAGTVGTTSGQFGYYLWPNGSPATNGESIESAESAIKHIIKVNLVDRLGLPVHIEPDLMRGGDIAAAGALPPVRFETVEEIVEKIQNWSGLGLRFWQVDGEKQIRVDVYEPGVWQQPLTPESGIIRFGTYSVNAPNITRGIVGGPGEGLARAFAGTEGAGYLTPREELYGDIIEIFRGATGAELLWPEALAENYKVPKYYEHQVDPEKGAVFRQFMADAEQTALLEGAATSGLELTLAESETFHFGGADGIQVGDHIIVKANDEYFSDQLMHAEISFTRDDGLKVTPVVGEKTDDPDEMFAKAIANMARALRNITTAQ